MSKKWRTFHPRPFRRWHREGLEVQPVRQDTAGGGAFIASRSRVGAESMTHPDLARYHALLAEADALARTLYWRITLTAETIDAIAERLRDLLTGRPFSVTDSVQVYPHSRLKGITIGRCEELDEAWVDLFVQMENGPRYNFSTAAYSPYSAPVFCFAPESVTIERVKLARPPYGYPQRLVFAIEEGE